MNQTLARSILVLFATSALGAAPSYAASRALPHGGDPGEARLTRAVERGDASAELILAATHRRHHPAPAAKTPTDEDQADASATYKVKSGDTLGKIADKLGVSVAELKSANHIKGTAIDVGQVLKVPGKAAVAKAAAKAAPAAEDDGEAGSTYKARKGDTLAKVAARLGVSVAELKSANHIKGTSLRAGQELTVPGKAVVTKAAARSGRAAKAEREEPPAPTTYKVKHGDTLFSISKKVGVSVEDLRAANGLSRRAAIHSGQVLKLSAEPQDEAPVRSVKATTRRHAAEEDAADQGQGGQAAGRVVEVEGRAVTYKVKKGDTLEEIADKLDTDVARLKKDNRLKSSHIRPGQVLKGPRTTARAYVARGGDTLPDIARRFGISTEKLRAANGLSRHAKIRSGQKIILPAGYRDHGPISAPERTPVRYPARPLPVTPAPTVGAAPGEAQPAAPTEQPSTTTNTTPSTPRPYTPSPSYTPRPYAPPAVTNGPPLAPTGSPPPTDAQISELGRGRFQWPVKGQIISDFGPKTPGQRNDGVNIQAAAGDPVRAAAGGDVVYAGDQVPGFGNLVLIKHADGWVTAYGHLSRVEVKMQQKVVQGQEIGQAGTTGGVTEPQVHFEVRYAPNPLDRARPIDPKLVLPK
jgi:murein DD-endopeptidase MepM/ murein hydrolase activator NlpD